MVVCIIKVQCLHPFSCSNYLLGKRKRRVKLAPSTFGSDKTALFRRVTETVPLTTVSTSQDSPADGAEVDSSPDLYIERVYRDPRCEPGTNSRGQDANPDTADGPASPAKN